MMKCLCIKELPKSLTKCKALSLLDLRCCKKLKRLPGDFCNLDRLRILLLAGCSNLVDLSPSLLQDLPSLELLDTKNCLLSKASPGQRTEDRL